MQLLTMLLQNIKVIILYGMFPFYMLTILFVFFTFPTH
uniref:Uncharacterized protein n=1 Tax=Anguilla anguilla TaxID=7936 RepID=A0A0E9UL21_ANGAN